VTPSNTKLPNLVFDEGLGVGLGLRLLRLRLRLRRVELVELLLLLRRRRLEDCTLRLPVVPVSRSCKESDASTASSKALFRDFFLVTRLLKFFSGMDLLAPSGIRYALYGSGSQLVNAKYSPRDVVAAAGAAAPPARRVVGAGAGAEGAVPDLLPIPHQTQG
jgi:hypothetical protein